MSQYAPYVKEALASFGGVMLGYFVIRMSDTHIYKRLAQSEMNIKLAEERLTTLENNPATGVQFKTMHNTNHPS